MAFSSNDFREWVLLAEGGEAEVFRAHQNSLERPVAIKRLKYAALVNSGAIQRFGGEAKLSASLRHPSLVQVFDYGQEGPYWCIVMEYVDGIDFGKLLQPHGGLARLPRSLQLDLARQLVEVMIFLHAQDVVHRDLKPENVMVDRQGRVKLLDLGLARASQTLITDPHGATLRGTLAYIAPELLRGQGSYNSRSEYYALALVVMELFHQKRLLSGGSPNDVLARIQSGPSEEDFRALPEQLRAPIRQCLLQNPEDRPSSLRPLLDAIAREAEAVADTRFMNTHSLQSYVLYSHRNWLWREVVRLRTEGKVELAFGLGKELVELIPDDKEAQLALLELGSSLNEKQDIGTRLDIGVKRNSKNKKLLAGFLSILVMILVAALYVNLRGAESTEDLGDDLVRRQQELLSRDSDALFLGKSAGQRLAKHLPTSGAYGVLIIEGLPKGYVFRVNGGEYRTARSIQLLEDRYMLEVRDQRKRRVLTDSITVVPGEPTVFQFGKKGR